jgi:hypothetical protein
MLKRINERQSFYDVKHWEKDYVKSQTYKKNICVFPSIAFHKNSQTDFNFGRSYYSVSPLKSRGKSTFTASNFNFPRENFEEVNNINLGIHSHDEPGKLLYSKKVYLGDFLSHCTVLFYVKSKT